MNNKTTLTCIAKQVYESWQIFQGRKYEEIMNNLKFYTNDTVLNSKERQRFSKHVEHYKKKMTAERKVWNSIVRKQE